MRIWKGIEQEIGIYKGQEMLFIEGVKVNINKVLQIANQTKIYYLYFGAGKVEFTDFDKIKNLSSGFIILIETTHPEKIPKDLRCTVVYRIENPELNRNTILKVEDEHTTATIHLMQMYIKNLTYLNPKTMRYNTDELLWEDKQ